MGTKPWCSYGAAIASPCPVFGPTLLLTEFVDGIWILSADLHCMPTLRKPSVNPPRARGRLLWPHRTSCGGRGSAAVLCWGRQVCAGILGAGTPGGRAET